MDRRHGARRTSPMSGGGHRPPDPDPDGSLAELIPLGRRPGASVLVYDPYLRARMAVGPLFDDAAGPAAGQSVADLMPEGLGTTLERHLRAALAGDCRSLEQRTADRTYWLEIEPLRGEDGEIASGMAVALDVTDRATALAALRDSEERFRTAFEDAPIGMALVALDGRFMRVNSALTELTGHSAERLVTTTLQQISHPEDASGLEGDLRRLAAGEVDGVAGEARDLQPGGEVVSASLNIALVRDRVGGPQHLVLQAQDITDRKRYEDQLQYLADHDALTGLHNRRGFRPGCATRWPPAQRNGAGGRADRARSRPLQVRQRHARPQRRRRAAVSVAALCATRCARRRAGAARRRRVRRDRARRRTAPPREVAEKLSTDSPRRVVGAGRAPHHREHRRGAVRPRARLPPSS